METQLGISSPLCHYMESITGPTRARLSRRDFIGNCAILAAASKFRFNEPLSTGLDEARLMLRKEQAEAANEAPSFPHAVLPDATQLSLERLHIQRQVVPTKDPERVRRGEFSFHRDLECERMQRAEELIRRVAPGPYEDPGYFAYLAYEAASFEMVFPKLRDQFSRTLFGTVHEAMVDSFAHHTNKADYTVIFMNSGLVDFFYQAAKASVEAQQPTRINRKGRSFVGTDVDLEEVRAGLKTNPAPVERLYRTLESYFYLGYPRAFWNEPLLPEESVVLEALEGMTERWALAHEYGHGLALGVDLGKAPNPAWAEEFFADTNAAILTVLSAATLDGLPPEVALTGGNFGLACLEIVRRAYSIVTAGYENQDKGTETHPPYLERAQQNIAVFRRFFDVKYETAGPGFDLRFVMRDHTPDQDNFGKDRASLVYVPSNVLLVIWPTVRELLLQQYKAKRPLHKMWH